MIRAYKLLRRRRDGTLGSIMIHRRAVLPMGVWLKARPYPTDGFKTRPGWHALAHPRAPHLSPKGRVWYRVALLGVKRVQTPEHHGGLWYLAKRMKILGVARAGPCGDH